MKLSEFDYTLPRELIAQYPLADRDKCRMMVLDRASGEISDRIFEEIVEYFNEGDCLILNNTKVILARLFGKRVTGGKVELFLLEKKNPVCEAFVRPSARLKDGERIILESGDEVEVLDRGLVGRRIRFSSSLGGILKNAGHVPLPPYIDRVDEESDKHSYQTIYGINEGATASPTAGLHFTEGLLKKIAARGVKIAYVTLHTSYGTFAPVKTEDIEEHKMHKEYFELPEETAEVVSDSRKKGGKIFAVGTTTTRVLEHCANLSANLRTRKPANPACGYTDLYIYPGYKFKVVDRLITNFHLPKSTLMLLVSAFAGRDIIFEAYRQAIKRRYRFFSYGDAMLIL